ncbi:MAG: DUF262 domain-containing protein [Sphingomicrobium sp.]
MNEIRTLRTGYRVSDFLTWQGNGSLQLNPDFQRRAVWKKKAKSFLIDTILRGLPMPIIFLRDLKSDLRSLRPKRDVVDGQQRIRTILSFVDGSLLPDFDPERDEFTIDKAHNPDLAGKTFADLLDDERQAILDYEFSVHSFAADTDDRDILQIFARMNSTGLKLNPQELRNAEWFGEFKTLAYSLATEQLQRWRDWGIFSPDDIARMSEVELTSEFMLLILNGILAKSKKVLDTYYEIFDEAFRDGPEVARRTRATFETIEALLSKEEIRQGFSTRSMFFALFTSVYGLQFEIRTSVAIGEWQPLKRQKAKPLPINLADRFRGAAAAVKDGTAPGEVLAATRGATADAKSRRAIIEYLLGPADNPCPPLP